MKLISYKKSQYSWALIISLFLHMGSFCLIFFQAQKKNEVSELAYSKALKNATHVKLDSVKFITRKQLQEIKALNKQIVANELTGKKERPANSRFAGEQDQTFDRQTLARTIGAFKKAGLGTADGQADAKALEKGHSSPEEQKKTVAHASKPKAEPKALSLSDLGTVKINKIGQVEKIQEENLGSVQKDLDNQMKRAASAQGIAKGSSDETGFSRNNDFIEDVPLGDVTNLNTTEFKYYGFYNRIRQKLEQYWGNSIQSKAKHLYKSGRRMPSSENLITAISVTLDDRGQILEIKIEGTSGVRELDQAAIESFNKAGPFPNPPKGLLVDGRAVIQWGFVVKS